MHIGGRLQVVEDGKIVRLDPAGKHHASRAGFSWKRGDAVDAASLQKVADTMADALVAAISATPLPHDIAHLYLTDPIGDFGHIDGVMFSGGVAEYVYQREERDFGDMGPRLGRAIRARIDGGALPWPVLPAGECIRATALGASEYSVQLSGNTSYISAPGKLLPRRNLQVLLPPFACAETIDPEMLAQAIRSHITAFDVADRPRHRAGAALERRALLSAARRVRRRHQARPRPTASPKSCRSTSCSMATWRRRSAISCATNFISKANFWSSTAWCLWDFDYIDLGRIRMPSYTVPVTIKSLVFSEDPRGPRPRQRLHHHDHEHDHRARSSRSPRSRP